MGRYLMNLVEEGGTLWKKNLDWYDFTTTPDTLAPRHSGVGRVLKIGSDTKVFTCLVMNALKTEQDQGAPNMASSNPGHCIHAYHLEAGPAKY